MANWHSDTLLHQHQKTTGGASICNCPTIYFREDEKGSDFAADSLSGSFQPQRNFSGTEHAFLKKNINFTQIRCSFQRFQSIQRSFLLEKTGLW
ncbi:hypothetical protein TNCT_708081 [Trichonephila clavata]|uniref:Uncharacterized protein n=1 Tax=Trichonephila clavata TaxID=2740835 RepID=A0A8X6IAE7_TRICU|nr:hypothetical protein TNCT_708081 [Trichonephila clavata]